MDDIRTQKQFESQFHQQLRARAAALVGTVVPAERFQQVAVDDGADSVRATLTRLQRYERGLLDELPGTRTTELRFERRVFGPFHRTAAKLRAQVLAPLDDLLGAATPGPVGSEQVLDALARYKLLPERHRPEMVVYASPTGFTDAAKALVERGDAPALALLGGRPDGGWDVTVAPRLANSAWRHLFELESQNQRLKRLLTHLEQHGGELESQGLTLPALAERLGLPVAQVEPLVRQACRNDPRLMTVAHEGHVILCRSPLAEEEPKMNLWTRIRRLLRMKPTPAERVKALTAQRMQLEQQRRELDGRLDHLEGDERKLLEQGGAAKTDAERKQLAGKLMRTRRDLRRVRAQANVLTQQIDIIGTHIHHQALAEQGKRVALPSAEELTQEAAEAEQVMGELSANAELAAGIEVGAESTAMADEEAAIFAEFQQAAASEPEPAANETPAREAPARTPERAPDAAPSQRSAEKGPANPEAN